jgi:precorrin-6B methylase 2
MAGRFHPVVIEALGLRPDDVLLDVGCGSGGLLGRATLAHRVAGADASEIQLQLTRRRLADKLAAGTAAGEGRRPGAAVARRSSTAACSGPG